jgi:hypothetical protein
MLGRMFAYPERYRVGEEICSTPRGAKWVYRLAATEQKPIGFDSDHHPHATAESISSPYPGSLDWCKVWDSDYGDVFTFGILADILQFYPPCRTLNVRHTGINRILDRSRVQFLQQFQHIAPHVAL